MTKKLSIVFLIIIILLMFSTSSFATINAWGKQFPDFPEEFDEYNEKYTVFIAYYENMDRFDLFLCKNDVFYSSSSNSLYLGNVKRYGWKPDSSSSWSLSWENGNGELANFIQDDTSSGYKRLVFSNKTILNSETQEAFFYETPLTTFSEWQSTIGGNIWQTAMKIIALTLVVVVCYLGLRKGLRMLLTLLRRRLVM